MRSNEQTEMQGFNLFSSISSRMYDVQ